MSEANQTGVLLEHLFRREAGRLTAHLARLLGPARLDLAEETVQEAMLRALQTWPYQGVPTSPGAWLYRVAHNAAIDSIRRTHTVGQDVETLADLAGAAPLVPGDPECEEQLRDDELRMIFMCSHPGIPRDASVALSLKLVGGFGVREIASAFLVEDSAVAQRLVRAKAQIRDRGLTMSMPQGPELEERLDSVLEVIYLVFNEGYAAHQGDGLIRQDLCAEALRLGLLVADSSMAAPRVHALVALMALQAARLPARVDGEGELVLLESQNRNLWDDHLIAMGFNHFDRSMSGDTVSEYHAQAAIAATHARAASMDDTDWPMILHFYDQLLAMSGSPVVALNRAVAVAKVRGPQEALAAIEPLESDPKLRHYHLLVAVRGHLLKELGRRNEAADCFRSALARRCSEPERRFLQKRLAECEAGTGPGIL